MTAARIIEKLLGRTHGLAVLYYVLTIAVLVGLTWICLADLADRYLGYSDKADLLARIEGRLIDAESSTDPTRPDVKGSPFLEGNSLTIAGAALQKRVTTAVEEAGGNVLSSQIDLQPTQDSTNRVSLTVSCEVEQSALQTMLYELEAGMPFLFIDRLLIQSPQQQGAEAEADSARMRITMNVSGQWQHSQ